MIKVEELPEGAEETLSQMQKNHPKRSVSRRAHMILLSAKGYTRKEIAAVYGVKEDTVSRCIKRWKKKGVAGLLNNAIPGRPRILTEEEEELAVQLIEEDRRNSKQAHSQLEAKTGKKVSEWTYKRTLKRAGLRWKRMRKSLKQRQDQEKVAHCRDEIAKLEAQTAAGEIALYYFDESGVSTVPEVPYGWQTAGETVQLPAFRTPRLNILGFFSQSQPFYSETVDGRVDSDRVIACFDNFANSRQMPTVVLIDNASIHTSKKFKERLPVWEAQGLSLYYLPPYSPELNLIEIVWRFLKYKWLPLSAYQNRPTLRASLLEILAGIGSEYTISFA